MPSHNLLAALCSKMVRRKSPDANNRSTADILTGVFPHDVQPYSAAVPIAAQAADTSKPSAVGWERNAQGKLAPKMADLGPLMDPTRQAKIKCAETRLNALLIYLPQLFVFLCAIDWQIKPSISI